jgi:hypothetical protein
MVLLAANGKPARSRESLTNQADKIAERIGLPDESLDSSLQQAGREILAVRAGDNHSHAGPEALGLCKNLPAWSSGESDIQKKHVYCALRSNRRKG